ncbi:MAG: TonB-dependent receptor [Cyclobacteriaceae bacterium]
MKEVRIDINLNQVSLSEALASIEKSTGYNFVVSKEKINLKQRVDLNHLGGTVEDVLLSISRQANVRFQQINKNIDISKIRIKDRSDVNLVEVLADVDISGKITDENGEGLPGASVVVKATTVGTTTDLEGNYKLSVPDQSILVVSFVGYKSREIEVGNQSVIDIQMELDAEQLEEIVVIGYGTAKLKNITGSVVQVDLEDSPVGLLPTTSILQSLRGGVAGVNIGTQNSVGETPSIVVRGQNSINGSNDPLIVLDGTIFLGSVSDINPADIASIDVLKDASAAAAYGSRSANGVIMINTKKGKTDKPTIRLSTSTGVNTWSNKMDLMETPRYLEKYAVQNNFDTVDDIVWDDGFRTTLFDQRVNTNWLDLVSRNGSIQDHQLSVSGKTDKIDYFFSGGYGEQKGVIVGDEFKRISARARLNADVTSWLEVSLDGAYNNNDRSGIVANLGTAMISAPIGYPYRYDGMPNNVSSNSSSNLERYPTGSSIPSPLWGTDDTVDDINNTDFFRLATNLLFKVPKIDGLTYKLNYSVNASFTTQDRFFYEDYYIPEALAEPFFDRYSDAAIQSYLSQANTNGYSRRNKNLNYVVDNIINYNKEFGNHYLDATLVATRDYTSISQREWTGRNFEATGNTLLGVNGLAFATIQQNNFDIVERTNIGYLARVGYAFKQKYHLNASYRRDGASVFGADQRWGNFSSIGAAWTVSEEDFAAAIEPLDYLKIKASYGVNGNQGLSPYQTLARVVNGISGDVEYEFGDNPSEILYGIRQTSLANPNLGWERTTSFNGGFQSAWLDNKIFLDVDFYFSKTTDQVFTRQIPIQSGFTSILASLGQVDNNGLEISLRGNLVAKTNFNWSSNLTFWRNRNKVVELYGDDVDGDGVEDDDIANSLFIGESLGAIYGYKYIGVVQEDDTEYTSANGAQGGDPMFEDLDGDGIITAEDRMILGVSKENFRMGLSNTVTYKNFSLYVMLSGIFGGGGFYQKANPLHNSFRNRFDTNEIDHDWWTPENKSEEYLRPDYIGGRYLGLQSRGFVRIQDITLSYKLPQNALSKVGMSSAQVYTTVKNLYTFSNWFGGGDPEEGVSALSGTLPVPTVYSLGLNVSF